MPYRPSPRSIALQAVLAGAGVVASLPAGAGVRCQSGLFAGAIEFRCSQPEPIISQCRWSATLTNAGGATGLRQGTFVLGPLARDELVVREANFDGKRITGGSVRLEGCAIGVAGTAASAAASAAAIRAERAAAARASGAGTASRRTAPPAPRRSASAV